MKTIKIILLCLLALLLISVAKFVLFWIFIGLSNFSEGTNPGKSIGGDYFITSHNGMLRIIENVEGARSGVGQIIISSEVLAWNFDSTFIVVKQKPYREIRDSLLKINPQATFSDVQRAHRENTQYNYWVINKAEERESFFDEEKQRRVFTRGIYGPFSYEDFWKKRRELNVSDSLMLITDIDWLTPRQRFFSRLFSAGADL